jgi:hypothetical protein
MNLSQNNSAFAGRKDLLKILICILIAFAIYYPLFYSEYLYTDESVQLWLYKQESSFQMFATQGRYVTEELFQWLFSKAHSVHDIIFIRLFSFFGWIVCIPMWYFIIKNVVIKEKLPHQLIFFSVLYIVCMPSFTIYVSWASCMEQFIANTAGLISGFFLYTFLKNEKKKISVSVLFVTASVLFGIISTFTYQNGFGCFLLPFLMNLISKPKNYRIIFYGIVAYLLIYIVYYLLFRYSLSINNIRAVDRTAITLNIFPKVRFFIRPLGTAFHFTLLFNESSIPGFVIYAITLFAWAITEFYQSAMLPVIKRLTWFTLTIIMLALVYLPSLVVKENYFSNRTLFALNMAVFFLVINTLLKAVKKNETKTTIVIVLSFLFVLNARINFTQQFLNPVKNEYNEVRAYTEKNYNPHIDTVYFIRPEENFFVKKYGVTRSWDEFGVPSTFFDWVPEFFVKQVVFEKTGDRKIAEKLTIKSWPGKKEFLEASPPLSQRVLVIDTEEIMNH